MVLKLPATHLFLLYQVSTREGVSHNQFPRQSDMTAGIHSMLETNDGLSRQASLRSHLVLLRPLVKSMVSDIDA